MDPRYTSVAAASASTEPATAAASPSRTWPWPALVYACYLVAALVVTVHIWAHPATAIVGPNAEDSAQFAWFLRYAATAVAHGRLPALVTTAMNAPRGINMMWNTSVLLPGVLLAPVTLLAGPQFSLTVLLTVGFAGSAASLFYVLRRYGVSTGAAAVGGAVYGFSPALTHAALGHYQLQFAVLPPLIIDAVLRLCLRTSRPVRAGAWLGLLVAAQVFIGEELLLESALAALLTVAVLAFSRPRDVLPAARSASLGVVAAAVVALALAGWGLLTQFAGPLRQHGSPFTTDTYKNSLVQFISPTSFQLLHGGSATSGGAEDVAYLGVTLIVILLIGAVVWWRQLPVRACAVVAAVLLLLSVGAHPIIDGNATYTGVTLPWGWLERLPVAGDLLPGRLSIAGDLAVAALLAFVIDLAYARLRRTSLRRSWSAAVAGVIVVVAVLPLVPRPLPESTAMPLPSGWTATFRALALPPGARVLVVPVPTALLDNALRWQSDGGQQISLIGGYFEGPDRTGRARIGTGQVLPLSYYLNYLWTGSGRPKAVPQPQIRRTLRYWRPSAVVADTPAPRLVRYLDRIFGRPTLSYGRMLAWRLRASPRH
jgi:hypothetical protein